MREKNPAFPFDNIKNIAYGEILTTLFMRFKSRDPVI